MPRTLVALLDVRVPLFFTCRTHLMRRPPARQHGAVSSHFRLWLLTFKS